MDWTSYPHQYKERVYSDMKEIYRTLDGSIVRVPARYVEGRVDTSQEHSNGDVTFQDVMVNSKRSDPRFFDRNHRSTKSGRLSSRGLASRLNHFPVDGYFLVYSSELSWFWPELKENFQNNGYRKLGYEHFIDGDGFEWEDAVRPEDTLYFRPMKSRKLGPYYLRCITKSRTPVGRLWTQLYDVILGIQDYSQYFSSYEIYERE